MSTKPSSTGVYYHQTDADNVSALLNTLAGLGVLSLGAGLTWGSVKALFKRMRERQKPLVMEPSKGFHDAYNANRIVIDDNYFPPEEKSAEYRVNAYRDLIKEADWEWLKYLNPAFYYRKAVELVDKTKEVSQDVKQTSQNISDLQNPEVAKEMSDNLGKGTKGYFSDLLTGAKERDVSQPGYRQLQQSDSLLTGLKARLATRPALRPLWFLPGVVGATALGWKGGNAIVDWVDSLLGEAEQRRDYSDKARKIYEESAKFLRDVSSGKIKPKMKKESSVKEAETAVTGDGSTGFLQASIIPGLLLAGWLAKQIKGVNKGVDDAKAELADRTHMLWAALAAQKERDYDYNGLYIDTDNVAGDTALDRRLNKKTVSMRDEMRPDNNNAQLRWENAQMSKIRNKSYR